ncbi:MAG: hypothetical protein K2K82_05055 [Muribaculaceae bacterium]|nr:hypothetical protein [Muribaculaceae bacterium]
MAQRFDDFNGVFLYEKSFKQWLDGEFKSGASSDYPSRLRRFFTRYYLNKTWLHQGMPIYRCLNQLPIEFINQWIDFCLEQADSISKQGDRNDITAAIKKFQVFLQQHIIR